MTFRAIATDSVRTDYPQRFEHFIYISDENNTQARDTYGGALPSMYQVKAALACGTTI